MHRGTACAVWACLMFGVTSFSGRLHAQADGVALFVAGTPSADTALILRALEHRVAERRDRIVAADTVAAAPAPKKEDVARMGKLGKDAQADLKSTAQSPTNLFTKYEPLINAELAYVSRTQAADVRAVLWNLCVLRVQVMIRDGKPAKAIEEAVHMCRRMFVDQYEFSFVWQPDVVEAFRRHSQTIKRSTLDLQSSPAGCQVLLFGQAVGVTPLRFEVQHGEQELQVRCAKAASRLHRVKVEGDREVVVRLDGDAAISGTLSKATALTYHDIEHAGHSLDHAAALAVEAGASTFVLASPKDGGWQLQWGDTRGDGLRAVHVGSSPSTPELDTALASLFASGKRPSVAARPGHERVQEHTWQDRAIGGLLLSGGTLAGAFSVVGLLNDDCVGTGCSRQKSVADAQPWALAGLSAALVTSGVTVLVVAPFARRERARATLSLGPSSIQLKGTF